MANPNPFGDFSGNFTKEEKAAVIGGIIIVIKTPQGITGAEDSMLGKICSMLDFNLQDPILSSLAQKGKAHLISVLDGLSEDNKEWFAMSIIGLLGANGQPDRNKSSLASKLMEQIGMTDEKLDNVMSKSQAIHSYFYK